MGRLQMAVGFTLVVLATICKQTCAVLPHVNQYTPQVVKPLFDQMREYGEKEKKTWKQYLVVLIASHDEIMTPIKGNEFRQHYDGRVQLLLNHKDAAIAEKLALHPKHLVHGEVRFIFNANIFNNMLTTFRKKHPTEKPVIMMYSHYIPCALIEGVKYSCSEEVAVFTTYHWLDFGLLVAFSTCFKDTASDQTRGTNESAASEFLRLGGIPTFEYTCDGIRLKNGVSDASNINRWHSVTFLEKFFVCIDGWVKKSCLPDRPEDRKSIIALFVNQIAFDCFRTMNFLWRKKEKATITGCLIDRIENRIGPDCEQCKGDCMAAKKTFIKACVDSSFDNSLVPGEPADPSNYFNYAWMITEDDRLSKIFSDASENRPRDVHRKVFCQNPTLTLESLCTCSSRSSPQGRTTTSSPRRWWQYCCSCLRG